MHLTISTLKINHILSLIIDKDIKYTQKLENLKYCVIDIENKIYILNISDNSIQKKFTIKDLPKDCTSKLIMSKDGKKIAYASSAQNVAIAYDIYTQKVLQTYPVARGKIEAIHYNFEKNMMFAGSNTGSVNLIENNEQQSSSLAIHKDFPFAIKMSKDHIITVGFDKNIFYCNAQSNVHGNLSYTMPNLPSAIKVIEDALVLVGCSNGLIVAIDCLNKTSLLNYKGADSAIKTIELYQKNYILALSQEGAVCVFDINEQKVTKEDVFKDFGALKDISIINDKFIVLISQENVINIYDLEQIQEAIEEKAQQDYNALYDAIEDIPFFSLNKKYVEVEALFEILYFQGINSYETNYQSLEIVETFKDVKAKKIKLEIIQRSMPIIRELYKYDKANNAKAINNIFAQYPLLKENNIYHKAEKQFEQDVENAIKLIQQQQKSEAIKLTTKYNTVSAKYSIVKSLFDDYMRINQLIKYAKNKDYKGFFLISRKYPVCQYSSIYKKVIEHFDKLEEESHKLYLLGEIGRLKQIINILSLSFEHQDYVSNIKKKINKLHFY